MEKENVLQMEARKLHEQADQLLDADARFHERDAAFDMLIGRHEMTIEDMEQLQERIREKDFLVAITSN